jgi:hypothetical protein
MCRRAAAARAGAAADGLDVSKLGELQQWYGSVPDLGEKVACLAWQRRKETPFIAVQGGINASLAKVNSSSVLCVFDCQCHSPVQRYFPPLSVLKREWLQSSEFNYN